MASVSASAMRGLKYLVASGFLVLVVLAPAPAPAQSPASLPPVVANGARIWFYQDGSPSDGLGVAVIRLNGNAAGLSQTNSSFYRDIAPGHYHISLDNPVNDINQTADIDIAPGQTAYIKIATLDNWDTSSGGPRGGGAHTTFYIWPMPTVTGATAVAHLPVYGG
jgi:hypothetical protein